MKKQLFLMRSGRLEEKGSESLKEKSKRKVQRMGVKLGQLCGDIDCAIHTKSPAAEVSCHKALKAGGFSLKLIDGPKKSKELLKTVRSLPHDSQNVLIVAKRKELDCLAKTPFLPADMLFPAAGILHLEFQGDWKDLKLGNCKIKSSVLPNDLPELFPFNTGEQIEYRDRPAYYYTQSAVIPYRIQNNTVEILLISSSSGRKMTVPKGISEPDMTAWDSAAREAFEEGGVRGEVTDELLGTYRFEKWGSECSVEVYPLKVTEELSDLEWEESHRKRIWLTADKASELVTVQALVPMIQELQLKILNEVGHD